ncbi:MAG: S-layer homology domain-containing protein [Ruminococcaceae bacterium]|nr:S-layer homology domain-containing protein [Oscillospiraceae bacterium]
MKRLLLILLCISLFPLGVSADTPQESSFDALFSAFQDASDPDIASLATLGEYDTDKLAQKKNIFYYPGYYHAAPNEELDYRNMPAKVYPHLIFKVGTFRNPNYVSYYLGKDSLQSLMAEDWYILPASVGGSFGALYYRKNTEGEWECCGASAYLIPHGRGAYFNKFLAERRAGELGMSTIVEVKPMLFAEKHIFLYLRDADGREELLSLTDNYYLGRTNGKNYLRQFDAIIPKAGAAGVSPATDLPQGGLQYDKKDYTPEAQILNAAGLVRGDERGFGLDTFPTRMEAIALLIRVMNLEEDALSSDCPNPFTADLPDTHWGARYAAFAYERGITAGTGADTFSPDMPITQRQFLTLLLRAKGETAPTDPFDLAEAAAQNGLIDSPYSADFPMFETGDTENTHYDVRDDLKSLFTRGDMIKLISNF